MTAVDVSPSKRDDVAPAVEPWGQQGILGMAGPALAKISLLCVFVACLLWYRSYSYREGIVFLPPNRAVEVTTVVGRIRIVSAITNDSSRRSPVPISSPAPVLLPGEDPWQNGLWKTIGFEVTSEFLQPGQPATVLRLRWHLIAGVLALYPAVFYVRKWRRSRTRDEAVA